MTKTSVKTINDHHVKLKGEPLKNISFRCYYNFSTTFELRKEKYLALIK